MHRVRRFACLLLPVVCALTPSVPAWGESVASAGRPIELVLALDTTGSMGGLIERAKSELWGIVDRLSAADPAPRIRVGLVAYRDRGDDYVTRVFDLSGDIDAVYADLLAFQAAGGGDGPESVNRGLYDAVHGVAWSGDARVQRVVILAGDAPPHMDYADDVPWTTTVQVARSRRIAIHAIQCGGDSLTREVWTRIAQGGGGRYAALAGSRAPSSPYDGELAALNRALAETVLPYGESAERARAAVDRARDADDAAAAARASYLGRRGAAATDARGDLVAAVEGGEVDWRRLPEESLPDALRERPAGERQLALDDQRARRRGLLGEIAYLSRKRDAWLEEHDPAQSFQREVLEALNRGPGTASP
jgi:hypothetical protein